jgi:hypothetical protein
MACRFDTQTCENDNTQSKTQITKICIAECFFDQAFEKLSMEKIGEGEIFE